MANRLETNKQTHETLSVVMQAIDLYWDNLLEFPQNTIQIKARDVDDAGRVIQEIFIIQRVYDTAYWIKCERSELTSWGGNSPVMGLPIDTIEYRLLPASLEAGKIGLRVTDAPTQTATDQEILMDKLKEENPTAGEVLSHLELNLLALLVGHSKERPLFDPLPAQARSLLEEAYGKVMADELWQAGMNDKPEVE